MKTKLLLFFLLTINLSQAQDMRLFENDWYLSKIVANNIEHYPPYNTGLLSFTFMESSIWANGCLSMSASIDFEDNLTGFVITDPIPCLCSCSSPSGEDYDNLYFGFLGLETVNSANYSYTITEMGALRTLILISASNEQAIYSSEAMTVEDFFEATVKIFPNPSSDHLYISTSSRSAIGDISIYNTLGQLCKTVRTDGNGKIDVSQLAGGLYYLQWYSDSIKHSSKFFKG